MSLPVRQTSLYLSSSFQNPFGTELFVFRTLITILSVFDSDTSGLFAIRLALASVFSALLCYQYIRYVPYYDEFASKLFGFECFFLAWIVANTLASYVLAIWGHFVVILLGILPVYLLTTHVYRHRIDSIIQMSPEKPTSELSAVLQCYAIYGLTANSLSPEKEAALIGLLALHKRECSNHECPLSSPDDLYDPKMNRYAKVNSGDDLFKNVVYLKHFAKFYFEAAIASYGNLPRIHVEFASFLFHSLRNIHLALTELSLARKNKPNTMQLIEIYKLEYDDE